MEFTSETGYGLFVESLTKPGKEIQESISPDTAHLLHMAMGIAGEAGELLDAVKKSVVYCQPLLISDMMEELGDLEFYMEGLRQYLRVSRKQTLEANVSKLRDRFSEGYSDKAAQERVDKRTGSDRKFIGYNGVALAVDELNQEGKQDG